MLTREEDVDAHALRKQGWTISAIARHLGRDRKTVRAYLNGERVAGERVSSTPDPFEPYAAYCAARLTEDPHLWATALFDEVVALGFALSYQSFTRGLRARQLRPACEPCRPAKGRPVAIIDHPPGIETQWDWLELPDPPGHWDGYRGKAFLLVGALSHSGKWRGVLCESDDQAHLLDALHRVSVKLGGLTRDWRFDRMASVVYPSSGRVTPSFSGVAKHYGVHVVVDFLYPRQVALGRTQALTARLTLSASDVHQQWALGEQDGEDVLIEGPVSSLFLWLWHRATSQPGLLVQGSAVEIASLKASPLVP
jgi:transposase